MKHSTSFYCAPMVLGCLVVNNPQELSVQHLWMQYSHREKKNLILYWICSFHFNLCILLLWLQINRQRSVTYKLKLYKVAHLWEPCPHVTSIKLKYLCSAHRKLPDKVHLQIAAGRKKLTHCRTKILPTPLLV